MTTLLSRTRLEGNGVEEVAKAIVDAHTTPETFVERCDPGGRAWMGENLPEIWAAVTRVMVDRYLAASGLSPQKAEEVLTLEGPGDAWIFPPERTQDFRRRWGRIGAGQAVAAALWPDGLETPDPDRELPCPAPADIVTALRARAGELLEEIRREDARRGAAGEGPRPWGETVLRISWAWDGAGVLKGELDSWHTDAAPFRIPPERKETELRERLGGAPSWAEFLSPWGEVRGVLIRRELLRRTAAEAEKVQGALFDLGGERYPEVRELAPRVIVTRVAAGLFSTVPGRRIKEEVDSGVLSLFGQETAEVMAEWVPVAHIAREATAVQDALVACLHIYSSAEVEAHTTRRGEWQEGRRVAWDVYCEAAGVGSRKMAVEHFNALARLRKLDVPLLLRVKEGKRSAAVGEFRPVLETLRFVWDDLSPEESIRWQRTGEWIGRAPQLVDFRLCPLARRFVGGEHIPGDFLRRIKKAQQDVRGRAHPLDLPLALELRRPNVYQTRGGVSRVEVDRFLRDCFGDAKVDAATARRKTGALVQQMIRAVEVLQAAGFVDSWELRGGRLAAKLTPALAPGRTLIEG